MKDGEVGVDAHHDPVEQLLVHRLCQAIAHVVGHLRRDGRGDPVGAGLDAARSAGLRCLLTPSPWDLNLSQRHDDAVAVFDHVGDNAQPSRCISGPPCVDGLVTLEYLKALVSLPG